MEAAGLRSLVSLRSLAVMGFVELIPSLSTIYRALRRAVSSACTDPLPDAIVTIDYKGFNFRLLVRHHRSSCTADAFCRLCLHHTRRECRLVLDLLPHPTTHSCWLPLHCSGRSRPQ